MKAISVHPQTLLFAPHFNKIGIACTSASETAMLFLATVYQYYEKDRRLRRNIFLGRYNFFLFCENPRHLRTVYEKNGKNGKKIDFCSLCMAQPILCGYHCK
jgi:hypothetical protein